MYFFDTYGLWELVKKNPNYARYAQTEIVCTVFNIYEFYATLRREFDKEDAKRVVSALKDCIVEVSVENVMGAVEMKKRLNRTGMSFIDCLGYLKAKELGIPFLTGDREFERMDNVEFVK